MKRAPLSRSEKRFFLLTPLAVIVLGAAGWMFSGSKRTVGIPPHAPMPTPNGFDLYVAAATAMTRPNPPVDQVNDRKIRTPQEAAKNYTPARRAAFVAANAKSWNLMAQARAAQTQHPDVRGKLLARLPYGSLRELARVKTIEAKYFLDLKRPDLALQSGLDTIEMGRDIEHGASLLGSLVGIAMEAIGGASLEDVPPQLSAQDARSGAKRLEKIIASSVSPADVLREEKWGTLTGARNNFGQKPNRTMSILTFRTAATIGTTMDAYIEQSKKPLPFQTFTPPSSNYFNLFADMLASSPKRYMFNAARRDTLESGLLLRLALRAYRVENGVYPANLSQLAPKYLAKIPRDAFGRGETLRYRKTGDSYLIWSIGPDGKDGKDDGGTPIPIKSGKKRVVLDAKSVGDAVVRP